FSRVSFFGAARGGAPAAMESSGPTRVVPITFAVSPHSVVFPSRYSLQVWYTRGAMSGHGQSAGAAGLKIADRRNARTPWYSPWVLPALNDPRDAEFVGLIVECLLFAACGI